MKKIITTVITILLGLALFTATFWLFFLAKDDNTYLLLFGLGTAVLVPVGISLIGYGLSLKKRQVSEKLSELSKISDIQDLLQEAKSAEEQISILKKEYDNLEKTLRYNSEKLALEIRREELTKKAKEILIEFEGIDEELVVVGDKLSGYKSTKELELLRKRVFNKEVVVIKIISKTYTFSRGSFFVLWSSPLGEILFETLKLIERLQKEELKKDVELIEKKE
jgi:hypothetical protein